MLMRTFDPFREFDRLAQQVLGAGTTTRPAVMPMDAWREGDNVHSSSSTCPACAAETLDIDVERNVLTIRAERHAEQRRLGDAGLRASDRPVQPAAAPPRHVDLDHLEASYDDGVLRLHVPVAERRRSGARSRCNAGSAEPAAIKA